MPAPSRGARLCVAAAPPDCIVANRCAVRPRGAVDLGRAEGQRCSVAGVVRNAGKLRTTRDVARRHAPGGAGRIEQLGAGSSTGASGAPHRSLAVARGGVQLRSSLAAHRAMRGLKGLPSALDAPRCGQLTGRNERQACGTATRLASAKSAVTAPFVRPVPRSPGVDNRFLYLSLRTGPKARDGRCRWPCHGRRTNPVDGPDRALARRPRRAHGPAMDRSLSGRNGARAGTEAIQGGISAGPCVSWCTT